MMFLHKDKSALLWPKSIKVEPFRGVHTMQCLRCKTWGPPITQRVSVGSLSQQAQAFQKGHQCKPA